MTSGNLAKAATNYFAGPLSDRIGRKPLIVRGMLVQAAALALVSPGTGFGTWLIAAILLGAGTAMVYPALLAAIGDVRMPRMPSIPPSQPLVFGGPASAMGSVLIPPARGAPRSAFTVRPKATEAHANLPSVFSSRLRCSAAGQVPLRPFLPI
jgi:MFS family permease